MNSMKKTPFRVDSFISTTTLATNGINCSVQSNESLNDDYNPFDHRVVEHPTSTVGSFIHLLKSTLGTGILAMPYAFKNAGLLLGSVATLTIGFLCTHCFHILVSASRDICKKTKVPSLGFAETCGAAFEFGPKSLRKYSSAVRSIVDIALVISCFLAMGVYIVFIAESTKQLVDHWYPEIQLDTRIYSTISMIPLLLSIQIRQLKYLVPFSLLSNVFLLIAVGIILYYIFHETPKMSNVPLFESASRFPTFLSIVLFAIEGIGVIMPIENTMKHPEHFLSYFGVLNIAMVVIVAVYAIIGFFGYARFGDATEASITLVLPVGESLAQSVKLLVVLAVFLTYNLQSYVALDVIWKRVLSPKVDGKLKSNFVQITMRCSFVVGTVIIAVAVPNLEPIITLVGSVCLSTLGIFLPAVIDTVLHWEELGFLKWRLIKNIFLCLFSLIALVSGSTIALRSFINS